MEMLGFYVGFNLKNTHNKKSPWMNLRKCEPEDSQRDILFNFLHFVIKHH